MPSTKSQAVLVADVRIKDAGSGLGMDLRLKDRTVLHVRASPKVLRLRLNLQRWYRATFTLRTHFDGTLREPLSLVQLELMAVPLTNASRTNWTVVGLVSSSPETVIVRSGRSAAQPLQISYRVAPGLLSTLSKGDSVRISGILQDQGLLANEIELIPPLPPSPQERRRSHWERDFLDPT